MFGRTPFRLAAMAALLLTLSITLAVNSSGVHADGDDDQAPPIPEKRELKYPNLSPHLSHLADGYGSGRMSQQQAAGEAPVHSGGSVAVTIYLDSHVSDVVAFLEDNGGDPRNVGSDYIEAYVPVGLLGALSEQPGVVRVWEIIPPQPAYGNVTSQAVNLHQAESWQDAGLRGQGVKVGVIDVGFTSYSALRGVELPAKVVARCYTDVGVFTSNLSDCEAEEEPPATTPAQCRDYVAGLYEGGEPHGTAVAEAVIDIAPDATLYIAQPQTRGDLQETAAWMADQGVTVINYSVGWIFDGPGDGTSPLSVSPLNTVDQAVARGVTWANAAGNSAGDTWLGSYSDHDGNRVISFDNSTAEMNPLVLLECRRYAFQLRWDDSWGGAATDLDIYLWDQSTNSVLDIPAEWGFVGSIVEQSGASDDVPLEYFFFRSPITSEDVGVIIVHESGPVPDWIHLELFSGPGGLGYSNAGSITNPAESANAGLLAVGAAPFYDTNEVEPFSSRGPTPDGRPKPDIVGVDCAASVSYELFTRRANGQDCWFPGTSQASPHVAGLAALVRQRFPDFTPEEVAGYLKDNAADRGDPGPDNTWGHGFALLPPIVVCSNNPGLAADCARLLAARDTLAGTGTLNWSANAPVEDWDGVTVEGSPLRVTELRLPDKGLTGKIPAVLASLSNLQELRLSENQLSGAIPAELAGLTSLEILALGGNQLTGPIPVWLGGLTKLEELYLWGNELTGEIPAELGGLASLEELHLSENELTGETPTQLGKLSNLVKLVLWRNGLTGTIPAELGSLTNLEVLSLSENQLSGEIPAELARLTSLRILALGGNQLSGTIPTWLGGLTKLEELYLWGNELTGEIPAELGGLASLEDLYLGDNQLRGTIPTQLGGLTNLKELSLTRNQLSGEIPAELAGLTSLEILALGGNQLTGPIPVWLGGLANLEGLYLWGNELTGTIPAELGSLANLRWLSLGDNQLSGEIPAELGSLARLEELRLHNNQLTGDIPAELGRLTNLTVLNLSGNQLTGCAPSSLRDVDGNDFDQLGLSFCNPLAELIKRYDANGNGTIERSEVIKAINDYLSGEGDPITRAKVIRLINLYLSGPA